MDEPEDDLPAGRLVRLSILQREDLSVLRRWFEETGPERQTCRPLRPWDLDAAWKALQSSREDPSRASYAVRRLADHALLGRVSWFDRNPRNGAVEIGFLIGPPHRRRGYAREAVQLLLDHLFHDLGATKAMAQTGAFNNASLCLLRSLGFREDGRLRCHHELDGVLHDDVLLSLLHDELRGGPDSGA